MKKQDTTPRRCAHCHEMIDKTKPYATITAITPLCFEFTGKEEHETSYLCFKDYCQIRYITL